MGDDRVGDDPSDSRDSSDPSAAAPRHLILCAAEAIGAALAQVAEVHPVFMTTAEKAAALTAIASLRDRLAGLHLRVMAAAEDVAGRDGARDVAAWLAHATRGDRRAWGGEQRLALALDRRWGRVAAALAQGRVSLAQARVITRALEDLPETQVPARVLARAEAHLIALAGEHTLAELQVLGRKILEVVAPETFEGQEAKQLEREERRARERTSLTMKRLGDGTTRVSIKLPDAAAARLRGYLDAFTSPRHHSTDQPNGLGEADGIPAHRKAGQAFCAFLEAADPARLPLHGGDATTLLVTIPLAALTSALAAAGVADTEHISAGEARRLACTATILPAVLGGQGEVLDLGRGRRLFTRAQRKALQVRDRACRAEGCTVPAAWCEAHHTTAWSRGGTTDLADGLLLCSYHHHRAHDPRYTHTRLPTGDLRYHRRT
ncbi:MAG TPA: DUF222 domain-containing protein [Marmoricola sp.]|nr:DUF222 domain-containing protein [Marmoricola sp.]